MVEKWLLLVKISEGNDRSNGVMTSRRQEEKLWFNLTLTRRRLYGVRCERRLLSHTVRRLSKVLGTKVPLPVLSYWIAGTSGSAASNSQENQGFNLGQLIIAILSVWGKALAFYSRLQPQPRVMIVAAKWHGGDILLQGV